MRQAIALTLPSALRCAPLAASLPCSEWADFDEKLGESVSIMGITSEFRTHKR